MGTVGSRWCPWCCQCGTKLPISRNRSTSLVRQTMSDFEVLAVDDGSSDESAGILRRWAEADERVRVLTRGRQGLVASLELARLHARGRFLARMDADDVAHPERLQHQLALMREQPELTGCGCMVRYVPQSRIRGGALRYERWLNGLVTPSQIERDLFVECPLAHPTFFLDASAVAAVGGYRDKGWPEDYDLILRLWEAGAPVREGPSCPPRLARAAGAAVAGTPVLRARSVSKAQDRRPWAYAPTGPAWRRRLGHRPDWEGVRPRAFGVWRRDPGVRRLGSPQDRPTDPGRGGLGPP